MATRLSLLTVEASTAALGFAARQLPWRARRGFVQKVREQLAETQERLKNEPYVRELLFGYYDAGYCLGRQGPQQITSRLEGSGALLPAIWRTPGTGAMEWMAAVEQANPANPPELTDFWEHFFVLGVLNGAASRDAGLTAFVSDLLPDGFYG